MLSVVRAYAGNVHEFPAEDRSDEKKARILDDWQRRVPSPAPFDDVAPVEKRGGRGPESAEYGEVRGVRNAPKVRRFDRPRRPDSVGPKMQPEPVCAGNVSARPVKELDAVGDRLWQEQVVSVQVLKEFTPRLIRRRISRSACAAL